MSGVFEIGMMSLFVGGAYIIKKVIKKRKSAIIDECTIDDENLQSNTEVKNRVPFYCRYCNTEIENYKNIYWEYYIPYCNEICYNKFLIEKNLQ